MWTIEGNPIPYMMQDQPSEPRTAHADLLIMVCRMRDQVDALELEIRLLKRKIQLVAFGCTLLALAGLLGPI